MMDLIIRGGQTDIAIEEGAISAIGQELGPAKKEIDARGLLVLPGLIDVHVHFNEPGRADWEGFACGSRALAAGGGTLFFDMPLNAHPPTVDGPAFDAKLAAANGVSHVDFAFWGGLAPGNAANLEALA